MGVGVAGQTTALKPPETGKTRRPFPSSEGRRPSPVAALTPLPGPLIFTKLTGQAPQDAAGISTVLLFGPASPSSTATRRLRQAT